MPKLPDFKELGSIAGKLINDIKESVNEIMDDYKKKRAAEEASKLEDTAPPPVTPEPTKPDVSPETPPEPNEAPVMIPEEKELPGADETPREANTASIEPGDAPEEERKET